MMIDTRTVEQDELVKLLGITFEAASQRDCAECGYLAIYTDEVVWASLGAFGVSDTGKLLELRAFSPNAELHAVRSELGHSFGCRIVIGEEPHDGFDWSFEDEQYLDVDRLGSVGRDYRTTGGGSYSLPIEGAEKIVLRNYVRFGEDDGIAQIVDFRIVRLK